jgi:hypothetical protein
MSVFLPVAGISINLFVLMGAGALVGFLSGLLGVGGGFLLTPLLMMIGIPPTVAAASDSCQIVAASASGGAAHFRLGNVDYKMGCILLLGGLSGAALGVEIIKVLKTLGNADLLITLTYIVVLGTVGGSMFIASLRSLRRGAVVLKSHRPARKPSLLRRLPFQMSFPDSKVQHSVLVPFLLCALVGILVAIMGVGGGFMMVPMMVYLLRMPPHVAVGTSLFQILFTSAGVTYMQATTNHTVDVVLALLLAAGSTVGAQIGARLTRFLRGDQLLIILASLALLVVGKMLVGLLVTPSSVLDVSRTHAHLRHASDSWLLTPGSRLLSSLPKMTHAENGDCLQLRSWQLAGCTRFRPYRLPRTNRHFHASLRHAGSWVTDSLLNPFGRRFSYA